MIYKSIYVSDLHLGSSNSNTTELLNFLKSNEFSNLYLVGDIIDILALKRKINWSNQENTVIQKILRLSRKNINIFYIIGNHDKHLEHFINERLGNIIICKEIIDKNKLIIHGDEFDTILKNMTFLYALGEFVYDILVKLNPIYNKLLRLFNISSDFSLSFFLKHKVKDIIKYLSNYEQLMIKKAKDNNCHTIICGHSHYSEHKVIDDITYLNCGSWTLDSKGSIVVEHLDGGFELIKDVNM
jgi:UDP-2,3-diacylglucosamine pyrophosphatase LpxH